MTGYVLEQPENAAAVAFVGEGDDGLTVLGGELFSFGGLGVDIVLDLWAPLDGSFAVVGVRADGIMRGVRGGNRDGERNTSDSAYAATKDGVTAARAAQ